MTLLDRVAAAPISWGVSEVPDWGLQLPVERVLSEMSEVGFTHTELGSIGYLPTDPHELRALLDRYGLSLLGGFVPLVLHDPEQAATTRSAAHEAAALISDAGGRFFVTAAVSSQNAWERPELSDDEWLHLLALLTELDSLVHGYGLEQVVHPHVDTIIEQSFETQRVIDETDVLLTFDSAHLTLGGTDVIELVDRHLDRVGLVHIKDVDMSLAESFKAGELTLMEAVQSGIFPPLGKGQVPIGEIVSRIENSGRDLWYVLEQDAAIVEDDPAAFNRPLADVSTSIDYLRNLEPALAGSGINNNNNQLREG